MSRLMAKKAATAAEQRHMGAVAALGCIVCRNLGHEDTPAHVHHLLSHTMGKRSPHTSTIPLCAYHHTQGGYGHAIHAGKQAFEARHGTEAELLEQVRILL